MDDPTTVLPSEDSFWAIPEQTGEDYYALIARLHRYLQPGRYLEIGVLNGDTLALAECSSIAIDPNLEINQDVIGVKPCCLLFQTSSDAFFSAYDPKLLLGGPIDMALIDGLHLFEYVLRDFINLERNMKKNSILILDDCIPTDAHICRRRFEDQTFAGESAHPQWWTGDAWKAVMALKDWRPELLIHAFNAVPTGLVAITNLDPASRVLADHYFQIVAEYRKITLQQYGVERYMKALNIEDTRAISTFEEIAELFWL
jgi:Methyltransferase domain